jgi:probable rRNA maturation factor
MITIQTKNVKYHSTGKAIIRKAAKLTLKTVSGTDNNSLTVMLVDAEFQRSLNRQFRGIDKQTDVLSFTSNEFIPENEEKYLGDIVISLPIAEMQAKENGHPLENELALLTIHGCLHLHGYDHDTSSAKQEMWRLQAQILNTLGIEMNHFSGDEDE